MAYFVRRDPANQWRWRLRATNNRIIAESGKPITTGKIALMRSIS